MNRRRFLAWLGGTAAGVAAAATLDVEKLLWTPGKAFSLPALPPPPEQFVSEVMTPDWLTREALRVLEHNLKFAKAVNREYDQRFDEDQILTIDSGTMRHQQRISLSGNHSLDLRVGDIITIAGINSVNPQTLRPTGHHQQFVVTGDYGDERFRLRIDLG